jgi:4,5-dihydroxyphthalate decarboxylase
VVELLRAGEVSAAVLGPRAIGTQGVELVPVIEDARAAGQAWLARHGTIPVNHLVVVRDDVLRSAPEAVAAFYRAMCESVAATEGERDDSPAGRVIAAGWTEQLRTALRIAAGYALEQEVVRSPIDVDRIEEESSFLDTAPFSEVGRP